MIQMTLKPLLALMIISTSFGHASAATIEIQGGKGLVEQYALLGAAYICEGSKELSTMQLDPMISDRLSLDL